MNIENYECMGMINRACMIEFLYELENQGINLNDYKPEHSIIKQYSKCYLVPPRNEYEYYAFAKHFHYGKAVIIDRDIEELKEKNLEQFFDEPFRDEIKKTAKEFADCIKQYPICDIVFSMLPDFEPFYWDFSTDCDTGFAARSIFGVDFAENKKMFIFEFYALIVAKMREEKVDGMPPGYEKWIDIGATTNDK